MGRADSFVQPLPGHLRAIEFTMIAISTILNLLLVMLGFGFIVFVHELGHFLAARWAGIRVLAFAIGFGPPVITFRKGLGVRRGSSEREYFNRTAQGLAEGISPTEYRLNALPFGGYVKMLGQEDLDPSAVSSASDSYQRCKPWKRMVVISAGVVMNILSALIIFAGVFLVGLKVEPAKIGYVAPGSAAAKAVVSGPGYAGDAGLKPGDEILLIGDSKPDSFNSIALASSMSGPHQDLELTIQRPGVAGPLKAKVTPETSRLSGLREIGVEPPRTNVLVDVKGEEALKAWDELAARFGFAGLKPGMRLDRVNGVPATDLTPLVRAIDASDGAPVRVEFVSGTGERFATALTPKAALRSDVLPKAPGEITLPVEHLLGLTPVMRVAKTEERARQQGLREGDIIARVGDVEYPSLWQGLPQIRSHPGQSLTIAVLRKNDKGELNEVTLNDVRVDSRGTIGFTAEDVGEEMVLVALPAPKLQALRRPRSTTEPYVPAAANLIQSPGTQIVSVNGEPVANFEALRRALREATKAEFAAWSRQDQPAGSVSVEVQLRQPERGSILGELPLVTRRWELSAQDVIELHSLGWDSPLGLGSFDLEEIVQRGAGPIDAMGMGLRKTKEVMLTTYLTFARLAQGTVKVEHLKGPVGIAHLGTIVASRGTVWLFFFMGLISINLAVINFLPLPIVDGGQFLFLVFEQVRGKPPPVAVQNAAALMGLVLIGCMFLIVTFNDFRNLLGL